MQCGIPHCDDRLYRASEEQLLGLHQAQQLSNREAVSHQQHLADHTHAGKASQSAQLLCPNARYDQGQCVGQDATFELDEQFVRAAQALG